LIGKNHEGFLADTTAAVTTIDNTGTDVADIEHIIPLVQPIVPITKSNDSLLRIATLLGWDLTTKGDHCLIADTAFKQLLCDVNASSSRTISTRARNKLITIDGKTFKKVPAVPPTGQIIRVRYDSNSY
jgi:hypothetical protein